MKKRDKNKVNKHSSEKKHDHPFLNLVHSTSRVKTTFGQRSVDFLTRWTGSWTFIFIFLSFLVLWVIFNASYLFAGKSWDPYPFILLNLALSCLAAIQAPIILMSQNREVQRDRIKAEHDYAINRKSEREIEELQVEIREIKRLLLKRKS